MSLLHARFDALHRQPSPLLLCNAWDAASARLWQEAGAPAIATSSAAVAWSRGYADGGALPRAELLDSLRGMLRVTRVPLSCDVEAGYSDDPEAVAELVAEIAAAGAVGINLEDGTDAPELLAAKIAAIRRTLGGAPLFINARTDVCLRGMAQGDAAVAMVIARLGRYAAAGADGGFVPGLRAAHEAAAIAKAVPLLINLLAIDGLPSLEQLALAGVRRVSAGSALFGATFAAGDSALRAYLRGNFRPCLDARLDYARTNALFAAD
jgi:2-methylisocitrate lyase-like PEP mutase family enzyme